MDAEQVQVAAAQQQNEENVHTAHATVSTIVTHAPIEKLSDVQPQLMKMLYEDANPLVAQAFQTIETKTSVKREHLVYGTAGILALYLIVGSAAALVCNLIGFGYPAYASVKAVRTDAKDDDTQWLIYWTVFASFSLLDFFSNALMSVLPVYWVMKASFLLYLALPQTRGALKMYARVVDPAVTKLDALLAKYNVAG
uniref:Receptor expression-enhancing protein n=1 Tax=Ditylenchus dipsaci TaxID=166011 RepID=A0A915E3W3_9BILA